MNTLLLVVALALFICACGNWSSSDIGFEPDVAMARERLLYIHTV